MRHTFFHATDIAFIHAFIFFIAEKTSQQNIVGGFTSDKDALAGALAALVAAWADTG